MSEDQLLAQARAFYATAELNSADSFTKTDHQEQN
jgi:hypothetical protein